MWALIFFSGCQSMTSLRFDKLTNQKEYFLDGATALASSKSKSEITLLASGDNVPNGERISLAVNIFNQGSEEFVIDTRNFKISSDHKKPIHIYSYAELVKEETDRRNLQLVLNAVGGAANSYTASQAGTSYTSGTFNANTSSSSGTSYLTNGSYSSQTYDPYKAQAAQAQVRANTENTARSIQKEREANLARLETAILKKTTIFPGMAHSGIIVFDAPPIKNDEFRTYKISVLVGDEKHEFLITQSKSSN